VETFVVILQGVGTGGGVGGLCRGDDNQDEEGDERQHVADELNARIPQNLYHLKHKIEQGYLGICMV
jgi:hypothetical protein